MVAQPTTQLIKDFLKGVNVRTLLVKTSHGGQGTQLRMGFAYCLREGYEGVITLDGNGKDDVIAIPSFIQALRDKFDYTQGSRFIKGGGHINTPLQRLLGVRLLISPILSLGSRRWYTDVTNAFRAYSKNYLLHPKVNPFREIFVTYDLLFLFSRTRKQIRA